MESTRSKQDIFIVADDMGLASSVNEGIFAGLNGGFIDGASLMPNGKAFEDAVSKIRNLKNPKIGVHLVLVEEKPLTLKTFPRNHRTFFIKYVLGLISAESLKKELEAQLNKCIQAGIKPAFVNSHQHLHLLPGIMDIVIRLAKEHGIPYIRIVNEPISLGKRKISRKIQLLFLNFLSGLAKNKIKNAGLLYNDYFIGFINAGNLTRDDILKAKKVKHINPDKIVELGCHPGLESKALREDYSRWKYNWKKELELLDSFS
jgi:predicted glycoside hydrolase/deacetylase ChbG (UPF0249 family)